MRFTLAALGSFVTFTAATPITGTLLPPFFPTGIFPTDGFPTDLPQITLPTELPKLSLPTDLLGLPSKPSEAPAPNTFSFLPDVLINLRRAALPTQLPGLPSGYPDIFDEDVNVGVDVDVDLGLDKRADGAKPFNCLKKGGVAQCCMVSERFTGFECAPPDDLKEGCEEDEGKAYCCKLKLDLSHSSVDCESVE